MAIELSVIIACKDEGRDIRMCLGALEGQSLRKGKWEAIFVDGGSTDGTLGEIRAFGRRMGNLKLLAERGNLKSAANARNQGAEIARGKALVFFDADVVIGRDYLREIEIAAGEGFEAAAVKVKPFPSKSAWAKLKHLETIASDYLVEGGKGEPFPNVISRKLFRGIGGYDAGFRYGEDLRLMEKLKKRGVRVKRLEGAVAMHRDPDSLPEIARQAKFWGAGFYRLFSDAPLKNLPRLLLVLARALWLPLYLVFMSLPWVPLLLLVALLFAASVIDAAFVFYRAVRMGGDALLGMLLMPYRMIRSFFFLQGFMGAALLGKNA